MYQTLVRKLHEGTENVNVPCPTQGLTKFMEVAFGLFFDALFVQDPCPSRFELGQRQLVCHDDGRSQAIDVRADAVKAYLKRICSRS